MSELDELAQLASPSGSSVPSPTSTLGVPTQSSKAPVTLKLPPSTVSASHVKVPLASGFSLADWTRKVQSGADLGGAYGPPRRIPMEEIAKHNKVDDAWMILRGRVYNITHYMKYHPGGISELMRAVGADGTEEFNAVHGWLNIDFMLSRCLVGFYEPAPVRAFASKPLSSMGPPPPKQTPSSLSIPTSSGGLQIPTRGSVVQKPKPLTYAELLSTTDWRFFALHEIKRVNHDSFILRFSLPQFDASCVLPVGYHVELRADIAGQTVIRPYTPITGNGVKGYIDFLIKSYPTGKLSKYLCEMKQGDRIGIRGPKGRYMHEPEKVRAIGMVAGGSGITPMFQIMQHVKMDSLGSADQTELSLVFANHTEDDILLKDSLNILAGEGAMKVTHVLSNSVNPDQWQGVRGYITKDLLQSTMPAVGDDVRILICGPARFVQTMHAYLIELGYADANLFIF